MFKLRLDTLRKKLLVAILIGFVIPYLISSLIVTNFIRNKIEDDFNQLADEQLDKAHFIIYETIVNPAYRAITALANDNDTKELIQIIGNNTSNQNISIDAYKGLQLYHKTQKSLRGIGIGTEQGGYFVHPEVVGRDPNYDPRKRPWYSDAIHRRSPILTSPYIRTDGTLTLAIAQAVTNEQDTPIGVIVFGWSLKDFQDQIQQFKIGSTGYIMVLDADNHFIVSPRNNAWLSKNPDEIGLSDFQNLENKAYGINLVNVDGEPKFMRVKISNTGWKIVSIIDAQEISQHVSDFVVKIALVYLLTFLVILSIIIFTSERLTASIEALSKAAVAFSNGETNVHVDIKTNDEIGLLTKTFNNMVVHIEKRNKEIGRLNCLNLIGETAAGLAHEIRNPLTTVRGYLQFLAQKEAKYLSQFRIMIEELDRANVIITEFLSLAKNKLIELKLNDLNNIINSLYPLIQADAIVLNKTIKTDLAEIPLLLLDENEIRQLILNLTRNGLDAMDPGTTLTIRTLMKEDEVMLEISDQGKGIDPKMIENLGLPFMTTKENGTGLGLAVCYSIAARHNARITVNSGLSGTTFYISFTLRKCDRLVNN